MKWISICRRAFSLSPVRAGEGRGEGPLSRLARSGARPLTLTLSPEYRGEGTKARLQRWKRCGALAATILLLLCVVSCNRNPSGDHSATKQTLTVFAAASLTEPFNELAKRFEREHPGVKVICNFAGSQQLEAQLEQGASADVFAAASPREMNKAVEAKLVKPASVTTFVHNHLVAIYSKRSTSPPTSLADLARAGLRIDVADPSVPVGEYTQRMLEAASHDPSLGPTFVNGFKANVVSREENVKAVVNKVRLREADAGIVYRSDLGGSESDRDPLGALPIPDSINQIAQYPIAPIANSSQLALAEEFIRLVCSAQGQQVLKQYGFDPARSGKPQSGFPLSSRANSFPLSRPACGVR